MLYNEQDDDDKNNLYFYNDKNIYEILKIDILVDYTNNQINEYLDTCDKYNFITYMKKEIIIYHDNTYNTTYAFCEQKEGMVEIVKLFLSNLYYNVED